MELIDKNKALIAIDNLIDDAMDLGYDNEVIRVMKSCRHNVSNITAVAKTDDTPNTIYISGAITGTDDYMSRFETAENDLKLQGYRVINPAKINANMPEDTGYEDYMKVSFCLLDMCDSVYMLKGWQRSTGANREYGYALGRCMTIIKE